MRSLERLLDSSLVWYNTTSNRGHVFTPRPRSDDSENRTRRSHQRTRNQDTTSIEIDRVRDLILRQIFDLLANLAWSSEALGFFAKVREHTHCCYLNPFHSFIPTACAGEEESLTVVIIAEGLWERKTVREYQFMPFAKFS